METFLPYTLNKAEREEDSSKVKTFGPFAYALGHLTEWGCLKKNALASDTKAYRGGNIPSYIFEAYKESHNYN